MSLYALVELAFRATHTGALVLYDELSGVFLRQIQKFVAHLYSLGALRKVLLLRSRHMVLFTQKVF